MTLLIVLLLLGAGVSAVIWYRTRAFRSRKIRQAVEAIDPVRPGDAFEVCLEAKSCAERYWPRQQAARIVCILCLLSALVLILIRVAS